jgi:hypothetical protein
LVRVSVGFSSFVSDAMKVRYIIHQTPQTGSYDLVGMIGYHCDALWPVVGVPACFIPKLYFLYIVGISSRELLLRCQLSTPIFEKRKIEYFMEEKEIISVHINATQRQDT